MQIQMEADQTIPIQKEASEHEEMHTITDDKGQVGQADLKGVTKDEISKKEGCNARIINSNVRLYDEGRRSWKHEVWSHKDLEVDTYLKGLHGEVNVAKQDRPQPVVRSYVRVQKT